MKTWNELAKSIHADNVKAGWWTCPKTGADLHETRDRLNLSMLIITELSEAAEAYYHDEMDDKLPQYKGVGVELADAQIRILDRLGADTERVPVGEIPFVPGYYTEKVSLLQVTGFGTQFAHVTALISGAAEGDRKGRTDVAVAYLREALNYIECLGAHMGFDMNELREAKREFNRNRADHKMENRQAEGGKKF